MWTQLFWPHNVAASAMNRMADSSWRAFGARGSRTSRKIDNTGCIEGLPNQETPQNQLSSRWQQPLFTNAIPLRSAHCGIEPWAVAEDDQHEDEPGRVRDGRTPHPADRRLRNSTTGSPPQPQFSSSTSSITTNVLSSGLCSTSSRSWLMPAMSADFSSAVT